MRTVFAFPTSSLAVTTELLDRMMPGRNGQWTDGNLFVSLADEQEGYLFSDWEPDDIRRIESVLGYRPTWAVQADVSGRVDGTPEIRDFLGRVLEDGGVAVDDYSDHCWTLQEIESGFTIEGLGFFDFRGHYERHYQP
ncbi:hypothetical protein ABH920_007009 [Catenulispora sp. EB89]|uniref:hypothetical protein n=1 Tax=Catenulispora sp. EB89 TaxID=3156257 RepID=UPI0035191AFC